MLGYLRENAGKTVPLAEVKHASGLSDKSWRVYMVGRRYQPFFHAVDNTNVLITASATLSEEAFRAQVTQTKNPATGPLKKHFRLVKVLGNGGYAEVWLAERKSDGQKFAVKRPNENMEAKYRLKKEIETMLALPDNRNTMKIIEHDPDFAWYSMHIATNTLELAGLRDFTLQREVIVSVLNALVVGHAAGYIHRDVTPRNILLLDGVWVLSDWGIGRNAEQGNSLNYTKTGMQLGTDGFAPPELYTDPRNASFATDVYSVGRVACWLAGMKLAPNMPAIPDGPWQDFVKRTTQLDMKARPANASEAMKLVPLLEAAVEARVTTGSVVADAGDHDSSVRDLRRLRRADFDNKAVFENHGQRMLHDVHPPEITLYRHIATGDCFQVTKTTNQYRQSHWASNTSSNQQPGQWIHFLP